MGRSKKLGTVEGGITFANQGERVQSWGGGNLLGVILRGWGTDSAEIWGLMPTIKCGKGGSKKYKVN